MRSIVIPLQRSVQARSVLCMRETGNGIFWEGGLSSVLHRLGLLFSHEGRCLALSVVAFRAASSGDNEHEAAILEIEDIGNSFGGLACVLSLCRATDSRYMTPSRFRRHGGYIAVFFPHYPLPKCAALQTLEPIPRTRNAVAMCRTNQKTPTSTPTHKRLKKHERHQRTQPAHLLSTTPFQITSPPSASHSHSQPPPHHHA